MPVRAVMLLFDEASAIDNIIHQVAEGAMTTVNCVWVMLGNPTMLGPPPTEKSVSASPFVSP